MQASLPVQTTSQSSWGTKIVDAFQTFFGNKFINLFPQYIYASPVIFIFGSLFLALTTLNSTYFYFSLAAIESQLLYYPIQLLSSMFISSNFGIRESGTIDEKCKSQLTTFTKEKFQGLLDQGIRYQVPNQSLYFLSFAAGYLIQCMFIFSESLSKLGENYSSRPYLSIFSSIILILLFSLYLKANGCDSFLNILYTILIGTIVGILLCFQNSALFGEESINVLFIPRLVKRTGLDYICVEKTSDKA